MNRMETELANLKSDMAYENAISRNYRREPEDRLELIAIIGDSVYKVDQMYPIDNAGRREVIIINKYNEKRIKEVWASQIAFRPSIDLLPNNI